MKNYEKITGISPKGNGHYSIEIQFRGNYYSATTSNMSDLDKFRSDERGWKGAGNTLYKEVVRKNNLR